MQFGWNILPKPVQVRYSRSSYPWNWYFFPPDIHCLSNGIGENTDAGGNKSIWPTWYFTKDHPQVCGQTDISGTVSHITRAAGFGGLFRGLGITATREVPAFAVYFSSYEVIVRWGPDMIVIRSKDWFGFLVRNLGESTGAVLFGGGMAGVLSWVATYPQDVIKSRLQADAFGASQMYRGPLHCLKVGHPTHPGRMSPICNLSNAAQSEGGGSQFFVPWDRLDRHPRLPYERRHLWGFHLHHEEVGLQAWRHGSWHHRKPTAKAEQWSLWGNNCLNICRHSHLLFPIQVSQKLPKSWKEKQDAKLSMLATDGPNILTIQEPLVSSISYTRMYPEQMLWACTETKKKEEEQTVWRKWVLTKFSYSNS